MSRWEFLKYRIHQFSSEFSKQKAVERKVPRLYLEKKVKSLQIQLNSDCSEELLLEYNRSKDELESSYNYVTEKIILRSKISCYEHGEKSSKYFLNLEKRNKSKSQIREILSSDNDREYTDPEEIMNDLTAFYSSLYTRQSMKSESECLSYLRTVNIPKLTESEKESCEGRLTKKEIWEALNSMANNKSPGNDGLPKEFYVCFFNEIHTHLLNTLNCSFPCGHMTSSQRQAMISLIEKKGRDKRLLKNWRPISLINVDAKIASKASKALALRIRKVLSSLISSDQTAYVKGRYIGESVRLLNDILEYTDNNNIEAILFSADFEKAFNSVDHTFLFATLTEFGFGPDFIQWVKTFLKDGESCVMNNGHSSGYFH